jgi:hypothetical protein
LIFGRDFRRFAIKGFCAGTRLAFAATTAHEAGRGVGGDGEDLSTEALFWAAKEAEGNRDDGTTFPAIAIALATPGQPESTWPYDPAHDITDSGYAPPPAATDAAVLRRARFQPIATTSDAVKSELAQAARGRDRSRRASGVARAVS